MMRLNFDYEGQRQSIEFEGDDLADLVLQTSTHFEHHYPEIYSQPNFSAMFVDTILNSLARDLTDIELQLACA